jgi:hypothetical protein
MARIEPQKPDQTFHRSREFQREVLAYLTGCGKTLVFSCPLGYIGITI